ncbi:MAG TPA: hypothetical protein VFZ66_13970 [Herpetosiphonaceae bacterium]
MKNSAALPAVVLGAAGLTIAGIAAIAAAKRAPGQQQPGQKPNPQQPPAANGGSKYSPETAAAMLKLYLTRSTIAPEDWGSKQSPNPIIADAQRDMGGVAVDGIYGPKTQARGAALTMSSWPARPAPKAAAKPSSTIPSNPVKVTSSTTTASSSKPTTPPKTAAKPKTPSASAPTPNAPPGGATVDLSAQVVTTERSPKQAAQALHAYVTGVIRSGRGATELGSKAARNNTVAVAQRDMRGLEVDGIYGPKTQARGKELLGIEFPSRYGTSTKIKPPVPPLTAANEQQRAAEGLLAYLSKPGADQGAKGRPAAYVKAAQAAMGGLTADGIYGPNTRARGAALTGKPFPPRK